MQFVQLRIHNHPAAAAEHFDILAAARLEQVDHILEELDMAALIGGDRNAVRIFLEGGIDDFLNRAVMAEMNDLNPGGLEDAAHDVDGGVVAVEQRGGSDETDLVAGLVVRMLAGGRCWHGGSPGKGLVKIIRHGAG